MFANRNTIMNIYNQILTTKKSNKKSFALLIDPDKQDRSELFNIIEKAKKARTVIESNKFLLPFWTLIES